MSSLTLNNQPQDDLLNIENIFLAYIIYPAELHLIRANSSDIANSSDTEAPFLGLNLSISNGIVSTKPYEKRDDFDYAIVISHSLMTISLGVPLMVFIYNYLI